MLDTSGWVGAFKGSVVDVQRWTESTVYTTPGYSTVSGNTVFHTPPRVDVHNTNLQLVFVRSDSGKEDRFQVDPALEFRRGSRFLAVWGSISSKKKSKFFLLKNEDTGRYLANPVLPPRGYGIFNGFVAGLAATFIGFIVSNAIIGTGVLEHVRDKMSESERAKFEAQTQTYSVQHDARNQELSVKAGPKIYAKYCPAGQHVPRVSPSQSRPVCQFKPKDFPMALPTKAVRAKDSGEWFCECPTSAEVPPLYLQALKADDAKWAPYVAARFTANERLADNQFRFGLPLIVGVLTWLVIGMRLAKTRGKERFDYWCDFVRLIHFELEKLGIQADTDALETKGLRAHSAA